jgi:hypothetical protein
MHSIRHWFIRSFIQLSQFIIPFLSFTRPLHPRIIFPPFIPQLPPPIFTPANNLRQLIRRPRIG